MSTEFKGPLRNPNLTPKEDARLDTLMDTAGRTTGEAWQQTPVLSPNPPETPVNDEEVTAAAHRIVPEADLDVAQPAPPQPGESDEEIRQRHRDALKERDAGTPSGFDPDLNQRMLGQMSKGDYTAPEQDG